MEKSETISSLASALVEAQKEMHNPIVDSEMSHFDAKYASLTAVINTIKPILTKHGLTVIQSPLIDGNLVNVETMILHTSGEFVSGVIGMPVTKKDAQGVGSAITYGRRYALTAMLNIAQDDDDGDTACGTGGVA